MDPPLAAVLVLGLGVAVALVSAAFRRGPRRDDAEPDPILDADIQSPRRPSDPAASVLPPGAVIRTRHPERVGFSLRHDWELIYDGNSVDAPTFANYHNAPYRDSDGQWWHLGRTQEYVGGPLGRSYVRVWARRIDPPFDNDA